MRTLLTKVLLFLALTLMGTQLYANPKVGNGVGNDNGGPKQSWQDIYRNPNLKPEFPSHIVEEREIAYNHLCLVGERIRTKYKYVVRLNFTKIVYDYLYTDRIRFEERCLEWNGDTCVSYETVEIEIPLQQDIEVFKREPSSPTYNSQWSLAFEKTFELKECPDQAKFPKAE